MDDSKTPRYSLEGDDQQDRWRLHHVRVEELVAIISELEEKQ